MSGENVLDRPYSPKRSRRWSLLLAVVLTALIAGTGGYLVRHEEVKDLQATVVANKAEAERAAEQTSIAHRKTADLQADLDRADDRLRNCKTALGNLHAEMVGLTLAVLDATAGDYAAVVRMLNHLNTGPAESPEERHCTGG